jgi:hypothetical protein
MQIAIILLFCFIFPPVPRSVLPNLFLCKQVNIYAQIKSPSVLEHERADKKNIYYRYYTAD